MDSPVPPHSSAFDPTSPLPWEAQWEPRHRLDARTATPRELLRAVAEYAADADERGLSLAVCAAVAADGRAGDQIARWLHLVAEALTRHVDERLDAELSRECVLRTAYVLDLAAACLRMHAETL